MNEWLMIGCMAWCSVLFAVGGTKGKYWRRHVLPAGLLAVALISGVIWWKAIGMALSLVAVLSMGYGSGSPYWKKAITFAGYGVAFLWIGLSWWQIITPVMCLLIFRLSNWKPMANTFFWKACEYIYGTLLGITFISCL
jgi:hypothetical protein